MIDQPEWDEIATKNFFADLLEELQSFEAGDEIEFPIDEERVSLLWPASEEEKKECNMRIIHSRHDCKKWLSENGFKMDLISAQTPDNSIEQRRHRRKMILRKRSLSKSK